LSAAFNSPLAGVVFVLEELQGKFASLEFFAATLACLAADMVCRALLGQFPVFHVAVLKAPDLALLLAFIPLGMLAGFFGVVFNQTLLAAQTLSAIRLKFRVLWWLACGLALGLVGWLEPGLLGGGQRFLDGLLVNGIAASSVALFFGIRFLLTIASYSTGSAGGIFSPILVLGALLGSLVENIVHLLFPQLLLEPNAFAVVGMAAYFTGVVRAPLTGIVLMIEMTGNYGLILPLFVACFSSLLIADELNDLPIYEALLERDLRNQ
jgi:CIC family chloride channel protein